MGTTSSSSYWGAPLQLAVQLAQVISLANHPPYEGNGFRKRYRSSSGRVVWECELEYFTHRFVASPVRDSNHLTNHPEALPLSPAFPLTAAIHDLSYIFNLSCRIDLSWILVAFLVGWEAVVRVSGLNGHGLSLNWTNLILGGLRTRSIVILDGEGHVGSVIAGCP